MKNFFKIFVVAAAVLMAVDYAGAQTKQGTHAVGALFSIGTGDVDGVGYTNYGLGVKYQWTFLDNLRLEPSLVYYFKKDYISQTDLTANVHYLFSVASDAIVYPIAGLGYTSYTLDSPAGKDTESRFAFNFGAGFQYMFNYNWGLSIEYKYRIVDDINRSNFQFGAVYRF